MSRKLFAALLAAILLCFMGCSMSGGNIPGMPGMPGESVAADTSVAIDNSAADTYISMAQTFIDSGDLNAARTVLKEAVEKCGDQRLQNMLNEVNETLLSEKEEVATTVATEATESPEEKAKYDKYAGKWRYTDLDEYIVDISFDKEKIYVKGKYEDLMSGYNYSFDVNTDKSTFLEYGCKIAFKDMEGYENVVLIQPKTAKFNDGAYSYLLWTLESVDGVARYEYNTTNLYRDSEHDLMYNRMLALDSDGSYDNGVFTIDVSGTSLHFYYEESQGGYDRMVSMDHIADVTDFVGDTISFAFEDSWGNKGTMKIRLYNAPVGRCVEMIVTDMIYDDYAMLSVSEGEYTFIEDYEG